MIDAYKKYGIQEVSAAYYNNPGFFDNSNNYYYVLASDVTDIQQVASMYNVKVGQVEELPQSNADITMHPSQGKVQFRIKLNEKMN